MDYFAHLLVLQVNEYFNLFEYMLVKLYNVQMLNANDVVHNLFSFAGSYELKQVVGMLIRIPLVSTTLLDLIFTRVDGICNVGV